MDLRHHFPQGGVANPEALSSRNPGFVTPPPRGPMTLWPQGGVTNLGVWGSRPRGFVTPSPLPIPRGTLWLQGVVAIFSVRGPRTQGFVTLPLGPCAPKALRICDAASPSGPRGGVAHLSVGGSGTQGFETPPPLGARTLSGQHHKYFGFGFQFQTKIKYR